MTGYSAMSSFIWSSGQYSRPEPQSPVPGIRCCYKPSESRRQVPAYRSIHTFPRAPRSGGAGESWSGYRARFAVCEGEYSFAMSLLRIQAATHKTETSEYVSVGQELFQWLRK